MKVVVVGMQAGRDFANIQEVAEEFIYDTVLPTLEGQGVLLTKNGCRSYDREEELRLLARQTERVSLPCIAASSSQLSCCYEENKQKRTLFDVEVIQKAYTKIDELFKSSQRFAVDSYCLKGIIERKIGYITNGEAMVAMLAKGHDMVCLKDAEGEIDINSLFNVRDAKIPEDTEPQDAPCQYQLQ